MNHETLSKYSSYLETPLLKISDKDYWTIRDAVRGVQIFGSIGSGKTSGSGKTIAYKYLKAGFGGLVLCAKPEEAEDWINYAKKCNRENDIIHFKEGSPFQFNALQYETTRKGKGAALTFNLTELFMTVFKMGQRFSGSTADEKESFWENSLKRCINRVIDLLKLANEEISIFNMVEILSTAPIDHKPIKKIHKLENYQIKEWGKTNLCIKCLFNAGENAVTKQEDRDYDLVFNYFLRDFPNLDEKVRSTIKEMFLGFAEPFLSGILNDHFAQGITIKPEATFEGKIIIIDFSVKEYLVSGIYAQSLFKYMWQQAVERREVTGTTKPVFLWIDESQYFVNEYDTIFQTTARSSRACTVFLTQNISNYYAQIGGRDSMHKVNSLLGNLATKIFHANSDAATNEYASRLIGNAVGELKSESNTQGFMSLNFSSTEGKSGHIMPQVLPMNFTTLKSGGEISNNVVEAYIFVTGKEWSNKQNFFKAPFKQ